MDARLPACLEPLGPFRWLCGLCRGPPHDGVSAHEYPTLELADAAACRHQKIRHPDGGVVILIVVPTEKFRMRPIPPGPYWGRCGACQRVVVGPYDSFNDADDHAEAHRWETHPKLKSVVLSVVSPYRE